MLIQYEKPPLPFLKEKTTVIPLQTEFRSSIGNLWIGVLQMLKNKMTKHLIFLMWTLI